MGVFDRVAFSFFLLKIIFWVAPQAATHRRKNKNGAPLPQHVPIFLIRCLIPRHFPSSQKMLGRFWS